MTLKVNDTEKFNISMTLHIDDEAEEITVHIKHNILSVRENLLLML